MKLYNIRVLILSRGRYETITTHRVLPEWVEIVVPESEKELYANVVANPLITIPDNVIGLGNVRNWILKNVPEETVIMADDDIKCCYCLTHEFTERVPNGDAVMQVLINTAVMANDMGVKCFGFAQTDIRKFNACDPFKLNTWVGGVIGIIGRKYEFRKDKFKVDIDYCLQNLLVERIVFQDTRYTFPQARDNNKGGNSIYRTEEAYMASIATLQDKWGDNIKVKWHKGQVNISLNVKRRQSVEIE